jgi:hypothetical protein
VLVAGELKTMMRVLLAPTGSIFVNDVLLIANKDPFQVRVRSPKNREKPKKLFFWGLFLVLFGPFSDLFPAVGPYNYGLFAGTVLLT